MTNPFNDPVDYSDGEEGLDYEDLIDNTGAVRDQAAIYTHGMRATGLVGRGTCVDEFEEREADAAMSRYEKGMGW